MRRLLAVLPLLLSTWVPSITQASDAGPSVDSMRRTYADKLAALGEEARAAHLGALALRYFDDANAMAPDQPLARAAFGWTKDGSGWKAPVNVIPGDGWADDGEPELARLEKKELQLRADFVKQLVSAASAAKSKKRPAEDVEELLWAAIAADPADPAPRHALGHHEVDGRFVAPEHEALLVAGLGPTPGDEAIARTPIETTEVASRVASLAGWPDPVPAGSKSPTSGQVHSLSNHATAREGAECLERGRLWLTGVLGGDGRLGSAYGFVHVGSLALARTLVTADPDAKAVVPYLGFRPILVLGKTGLVLAVGESALALDDALVSARVEGDFVARSAERSGTKWLAECVGVCASTRLFGTTVGYAASTQVFASVFGPIRRRGEPLLAFVRRLVAAGADPGLEQIAEPRDRPLYPREQLVGAMVVDWLLRRDPTSGAAFLSGYLAAQGTSAERLAAASKAAGFASTRVLDDGFRRFVADVYPVASAGTASKAPWKVAPLGPMKTVGIVTSLFMPQEHRVSGQLWLGGRPYRCEAPSSDGPVRFEPYRRTEPPRSTDKDGVFPFSIGREYGGGSLDVRVELRREGAIWLARRAEAYEGNVDGHPVRVFDLDVDGRFGGFGRDGIAFDRADRPIPLGREMALGEKVYEIRRVGPDGREIAWRARPSEAKGPYLEAWSVLNSVRVESGLPALAFDAESAMGAAVHATYLSSNFGASFTPSQASREDSTKKDATVIGARIAAHCLAADEPSALAAVRRWLASPREAAILLDPNVRRGALASSNGVVVFAMRDAPADESSEFRGPLVYPTADVPGDPGPCGTDLVRLDRTFSGFGCPVLVRVEPGRVRLASLRLELEGAEVPTVRFDGTVVGMPGLVALVPKQPLKPASKYRIIVESTADGVFSRRSHDFRTGDK